MYDPLNTPYFKIASLVYWEQEGTYRHEEGNRGDRRYWYPVMRTVAMVRPILSARMITESGAIQHLRHRRAPLGVRASEAADQEDQVMSRRHTVLERPVRFPREPLLPVPSDRSASPGDDHRHPGLRDAVALYEELQAACFDPSCRSEKPPDVVCGAESFAPSKASSHLRR